jgi:TolB protein
MYLQASASVLRKRANPERLGRMRKTVLLLLSMALALLVASGVGLLNAIKPAEATFPGKPGKIAYASSDILPDGSTTDTEIYTINPTGGTPFQLTNNVRQDTAPSYSPNGQRIAYQAFDGRDSEIYTIDATGGTPFQVTNNTSDDHGPSYSPNGQRIAFDRWDGTDFEIYTVNATGGGEIQVTNNEMQDFSPDYSPNGEKIAYTHCLIPYFEEEEERCGELFTGVDYHEIFTIKTTGGKPLRLTHNKTYDSSPSYSPNGKKKAYSHVAASDFEIYKISATGGTPVNITHNNKDDLGPSYSPNGKKIAYSRWDENPSGSLNAEIYKIHHNGGTPVNVTNSDSWEVAPSWGSRP